PGARHNPRAVAWPDLVFVYVDDGVKRGGIDQSLFHEQRFERLRAQRRIGRNDLMIVIFVVHIIMKNLLYMTYVEYGNDSPLCHMAHKITTGLARKICSSERMSVIVRSPFRLATESLIARWPYQLQLQFGVIFCPVENSGAFNMSYLHA